MIVLLLTHIAIALGSMVAAGLAIVWPGHTKLVVTYGLIAGTLISGTALVVVSSSNLMQSCVTGLVYLTAVGGATLIGNRRLAAQKNS